MANQNETPIAEISAVRRVREVPAEPPRKLEPRVEQRSDIPARTRKSEAVQEAEPNRQKVASAIMASEGLPPGRLVIEQDQAKKGFVYIIVDSKTGEEVRRWPKEQWMTRARELGFTSGVVVDKSA
jgi:uncharacterized FlaG/YvyC family protein